MEKQMSEVDKMLVHIQRIKQDCIKMLDKSRYEKQESEHLLGRRVGFIEGLYYIENYFAGNIKND